ncbi:multidrug resistance protein [Aspergillus luchuensis]|uniref:Multidrug resistance protein n=1 Tax=Aspergillus kawachii TaxID=1069201 RepID=A0A146F649_ASPKA|nr:multidrug resistance protein [Aspergillus luchuensis]
MPNGGFRNADRGDSGAFICSHEYVSTKERAVTVPVSAHASIHLAGGPTHSFQRHWTAADRKSVRLASNTREPPASYVAHGPVAIQGSCIQANGCEYYDYPRSARKRPSGKLVICGAGNDLVAQDGLPTRSATMGHHFH